MQSTIGSVENKRYRVSLVAVEDGYSVIVMKQNRRFKEFLIARRLDIDCLFMSLSDSGILVIGDGKSKDITLRIDHHTI